MEDLIDIQGLDYISWWPLALGWWMIIALLAGALIVAGYWIVRTYRYKRSWQYQSFKRLEHMRGELEILEHKQILQRLSQEMRKIAMQSTKRETCAGLVGSQWLEWLQINDPLKFTWVDNGALLINAQYMPDTASADPVQIAKLITAAQGWVKKC